MVEVEINQAFLRSLRGGLKISRTVLALMALICFAVERSHEAYLTLVIIEFVINLLFFLLYLLKLQRKLRFLFWPLADAFNSVLAAAFLLIVGLCATIIKTTTGTLVGGVFCLILLMLSIVDAVVLFKMITFNRPPARMAVIHR